MKHCHNFTIGERVWDDLQHKWGFVCWYGDETLILKGDDGKLWKAEHQDVYQIAEGLRTVNTGDLVCYEHNDTEDGYPYYCPALEENFFSFEVEKAPYDADLTEGSAYELVQKLQDAVLSIDGPKVTVPVYVEDENGRLENIVHIWYDHTRQMIRLTVGDVEFQDSEE